MSKSCVCGHEKTAHLHYRGGSDCSICGQDACTSYIADTVIGHVVDTLASHGMRRSSATRFVEPVATRRGAA